SSRIFAFPGQHRKVGPIHIVSKLGDQATAGNSCLPRCSDIYVSGVMETENCSRRSALKTMLAGTATGLLHAKEPHHDLIRLDSEYQMIENFSASDCWSMQKLGRGPYPIAIALPTCYFRRPAESGFRVGGSTSAAASRIRSTTPGERRRPLKSPKGNTTGHGRPRNAGSSVPLRPVESHSFWPL